MEAPSPIEYITPKTIESNKIIEKKIYKIEINKNKYELIIFRDNQYIYFKIIQIDDITLFYYINKYNYEQIIDILNLKNNLYEDLEKVMELIDEAYSNKKILINFNIKKNIVIKIKLPMGFKEYESSLILNKKESDINGKFDVIINQISLMKNLQDEKIKEKLNEIERQILQLKTSVFQKLENNSKEINKLKEKIQKNEKFLEKNKNQMKLLEKDLLDLKIIFYNKKNNNNKLKYKIPMNILVCGINIEKFYTLSNFDDIINYSYQEDYEEYINKYEWKFQIFKEGLEKDNLDKIFKKLKEDFIKNDFKDIIMCFIDSFENTKNIIKYFSNKPKIYHTFIIFMTLNKSIKIKDLWEYIEDNLDNLEYDTRNLDVIYYKEYSKIHFFNLLNQKASYFNEIEFSDIINHNIYYNKNFDESKNHFNIFILGKPGVGKSTLINILKGGKYAKECLGGEIITYNITKYNINDTNIILYDTPGVYNDTIGKINQFIDNFKEKFHCFIYMLNYQQERHFFYIEQELIGKLLSKKITIYVLINKARKNKKKKKKILEEEINEIFSGKEKYLKIIYINLLPNQEEDSFGLENLFIELYEFYKDKNIPNIYNIEKEAFNNIIEKLHELYLKFKNSDDYRRVLNNF